MVGKVCNEVIFCVFFLFPLPSIHADHHGPELCLGLAGLATGVLNLAIVIPQVRLIDFFAALDLYSYCQIVLILYLLLEN